MKKSEGFKLSFKKSAIDDSNQLPESIKKEAERYISDLKKVGVRVGKRLDNRKGCDLSSFYRIYCGNGSYRILYRRDKDDPNMILIYRMVARSELDYREFKKSVEE